MNTIDEARRARSAQLTKANYYLERLAHFIASHASAVDGDDRVRLNELSEKVIARHTEIAGVVGAGPSAVVQYSFAQLIDVLEDVASSGMETLQILGGRLARNEGWGGASESDQQEQHE